MQCYAINSIALMQYHSVLYLTLAFTITALYVKGFMLFIHFALSGTGNAIAYLWNEHFNAFILAVRKAPTLFGP
jgi:hypothetical protein